MTRRPLLIAGAVAGPLFTVAYLAEGATRPDYDPLRHPVSSLALGPYGWTQTANFLIAGALTVAFAAGLWRALKAGTGPALIGLWGLGLIGAGLFVTEPVSGYPVGTPAHFDSYSSVGTALHDYLSLGGFAAFAAATVVFAVRDGRRRRPGRSAYSAATGLAFFVLFFLSGTGFAQEPGLTGITAVAGLLQRCMITAAFTWQTMLALRALKD